MPIVLLGLGTVAALLFPFMAEESVLHESDACVRARARACLFVYACACVLGESLDPRDKLCVKTRFHMEAPVRESFRMTLLRGRSRA